MDKRKLIRKAHLYLLIAHIRHFFGTVLFPVFARRHACIFPEHLDEIRTAAEACRMAEAASDGEKAELLALADTLERVPAKPARTFRAALQSIHLFLYSLYGIYSAGRPDQYLLPYYRNDIENGILDEVTAQELIDCFCLQYMNNMSAWAAAGFMLGGRDPEGKAVENVLTWHFLMAISHTHTPDPHIRSHRGLYRARPFR